MNIDKNESMRRERSTRLNTSKEVEERMCMDIEEMANLSKCDNKEEPSLMKPRRFKRVVAPNRTLLKKLTLLELNKIQEKRKVELRAKDEVEMGEDEIEMRKTNLDDKICIETN